LYLILLVGLEELMLYNIVEGYLQNWEHHQFHHHFQYPKFKNVFDDAGKLREQLYEKRVIRFIEEFEWYIDAFKNQRAKDTPY
jgi:hypothetical protein